VRTLDDTEGAEILAVRAHEHTLASLVHMHTLALDGLHPGRTSDPWTTLLIQRHSR